MSYRSIFITRLISPSRTQYQLVSYSTPVFYHKNDRNRKSFNYINTKVFPYRTFVNSPNDWEPANDDFQKELSKRELPVEKGYTCYKSMCPAGDQRTKNNDKLYVNLETGNMHFLP